jgi:hypothetical protein
MRIEEGGDFEFNGADGKTAACRHEAIRDAG